MEAQASLFVGEKVKRTKPKPRFDGPHLTPADNERLASHLERVFELMRDGKWRLLADIARLTGGSEAGTSSRLRDFRKPAHGNHTVELRRVSGGIYEYRLLVKK